MKTILVIDNDEMMRENTAEILELSNYRVLSVENGRQGLEIAINKHPDLIICDEMIPRKEGYKLLRKIRETEGVKKIPFILITNSAEISDLGSDTSNGASNYLVKPFEGDELLRVVEQCLQNENHF